MKNFMEMLQTSKSYQKICPYFVPAGAEPILHNTFKPVIQTKQKKWRGNGGECMKTLDDVFEDYLDAVYGKTLSAENLRLELRRAFFAGCAIAASTALTSWVHGAAEAKACAERLCAEIDKTCQKLIFPAANPNN